MGSEKPIPASQTVRHSFQTPKPAILWNLPNFYPAPSLLQSCLHWVPLGPSGLYPVGHVVWLDWTLYLGVLL